MLARDKCAKFVANSKPLLTFFTLDVAVNRYALTDNFFVFSASAPGIYETHLSSIPFIFFGRNSTVHTARLKATG